MNITRNNYEEFFLLYADGELTHSDKAAVERFVSIHPDLGEELEMLMESVLETTDITMPGKHLLFKAEEWSEENLTGTQKQMLLLLDNELPAETSAELKQAIATDPLLQKDWSVLLQTQLPAASIEMPVKENLYRREKDRRPIPIGWVKWMAAAAVVAGIGWYSLSLINGNKTIDGPTVAGITDDKKSNNSSDKISVIKEKLPENKVSNTTGLTIPAEEKQPSANTKNTAATETVLVKNKQSQINQLPVQKKDVPVPAVPVTAIKAPVVAIRENNTPPNNYIAAADPKETVTSKALPISEPNLPEGSLAQQTIYNEDAVEEPEYVNIAGARIKKQKLRGIFRNVTRTVGRTFDKSNVAQADVASLNK
ncbi:MAG: hypothetical protein V4717_08635 [Bacteroidota bacterium]